MLGVFEKERLADIDGEVSVSVVGRRKMKDLTSKYLGDGKTHEVLSFPFENAQDRQSLSSNKFSTPPDDVIRFGDVVLSWPEVLLCAARDDVMVDEEVSKLVAHGVEHLLGKHHGDGI